MLKLGQQTYNNLHDDEEAVKWFDLCAEQSRRGDSR